MQVGPFARVIVLPEDFAMPAGGLYIRWRNPPLDQEMRLHKYAVAAAQAPEVMAVLADRYRQAVAAR